MQNKANEDLDCKRSMLRSAIDDCKTTQMSVIQGISDNDWDIDQSIKTLSIWKSKKEKLVAEWKSVNAEKLRAILYRIKLSDWQQLRLMVMLLLRRSRRLRNV